MNREANVACDFNCFIETERLLKVANCHVRCKCGTTWETMQDRDIVTINP